jgi:hypothetical protein
MKVASERLSEKRLGTGMMYPVSGLESPSLLSGVERPLRVVSERKKDEVKIQDERIGLRVTCAGFPSKASFVQRERVWTSLPFFPTKSIFCVNFSCCIVMDNEPREQCGAMAALTMARCDPTRTRPCLSSY